jgi:O-antigen/teichoic acid export membrane protein
VATGGCPAHHRLRLARCPEFNHHVVGEVCNETAPPFGHRRSGHMTETDAPTATTMGGEANAALEPSLRRLVAVNLGWGLASQTGARVVSAAIGIVLARILVPADYGVFAVASIVMELLISVNDLGLFTAIVRHRGDVTSAARTAASLTMVSSALLYALCFAAAPWVAAALNVPNAATVLRVAALLVLIDAPCSVPAALLTRAFLQRRHALAEIPGLAVNAALTIWLAKHGFGVWSLVWGRLAAAAMVAAAIIALAPQRPLPGFDRREARELLRFGLPLAGGGMLTLLLLNLDYIVVGRVLGPVQLGLYVVAFNICTWPFQLVYIAVQRVSVVAFARLVGERRALSDGLNRSLALLASGVLPGCLTIALLAGPIVRVVYGDRWSAAATAVPFLVVFGGVRTVEALIENFLAGVGRSLAILWISMAWLLSLMPAIIVGAKLDGIRGVGLAHALVAAVVVLPIALLMTRPSGVALRPFLGQLLRLAAAGVAAAAAVLLVGAALPGDVPRLLGAGAAALVSYTAVWASWPELRGLLRARRDPGVTSLPETRLTEPE